MLFSKQRYVDAAVNHAAWLNLQAGDLRRQYLEGAFDPVTEETRALETQRLGYLRRQFRTSFIQMLFVSILAVASGVALDVVNPQLPFSLARVLGFLGTFLIGWAALFELGGPGLASWKGETLSEQTHPRVFQVLFIPGVFSLLCSILV